MGDALPVRQGKGKGKARRAKWHGRPRQTLNVGECHLPRTPHHLPCMPISLYLLTYEPPGYIVASVMSRQEKRDARSAEYFSGVASEKYQRTQNKRLGLGSELSKLEIHSSSIVNVPFAYRQQQAEWLRLRAQRATPENTGMLPWQPLPDSRLDLWRK